MSRRRVAVVVLGAVAIALASSVSAFGEFRGTDVWSNITPGGGNGGLADRYPLSHYLLDYHVDVGVTHPDGIPALIMQFTSSWMFFLGALLMRFVILIFDWAFNTDILNGPNGIMSPLTTVVGANYRDVVLPFLIPAVMFFGVWISYKAVKREHSDIGAAVARTLLFFVVSFAIAFHPAETIGRAYQMVDQLSAAVVSRGSGAQKVSDTMFETFVYRPWAVLQFSGLQVCTGSKLDDDGFPLAATDSNPARTCHDVLRKDRDGHGDYAHRFIRYPYGSDERDAEYNALREGQAPETPQFADVAIDKTDAPAVDLMQEQGALQRFIYTLVVFVGMLAGVALLGLISFASLIVQVAIAILFALSSLMIVASILPFTHDIVRKWLGMLGKAIIGKLVYAVMIMITMSVSTALMVLGGESGFLVAFFAQSALYVVVVWKRKVILEKVTSSKVANHYHESEHKAVGAASTAAAASMMVLTDGTSTFAQTMADGWFGRPEGKKEEGGDKHVDATSPPASAGRDYSPAPMQEPVEDYVSDSPGDYEDLQNQSPSAQSDTIDTNGRGETQVLRSFSHDLRKAREASSRVDEVDVEHEQVTEVEPDDVGPAQGMSTPLAYSQDSFSRDLRHARDRISEDPDPAYEPVVQRLIERDVVKEPARTHPDGDELD